MPYLYKPVMEHKSILGLDKMPHSRKDYMIWAERMKNAFKQEAWQYGKIDGARKKVGIADIYIHLGNDYIKDPIHHLATFVGVS